MKRILSLLLLALSTLQVALAQEPTEGSSYYLPKTQVRMALLIEKTTFTPGEYARYSQRYLREQTADQPATTYRIVGVSFAPESIPDTAKFYAVTIDKKHTIVSLARTESGILTAINTQPKTYQQPQPFKAAPKKAALNPRNYMTEEMLSAGSNAKTAELAAREIYDIRDSRNQLLRGEADQMPKDGAQLQLMLASLDTQEQALRQLFCGTTVVDTTEQIVLFTPEHETESQLLFRFSKKLGLVDADDLAGSPYYISVRDLHATAAAPASDANQKKNAKEESCVRVNLPGKIEVTLTHNGEQVGQYQLYAAQFGRTEALSDALFGRKFTSRLQLNPYTGATESLVTEPLE